MLAAFYLIRWLELRLLTGMTGFTLTWQLLAELLYISDSISKTLTLGSELTLAMGDWVQDFWGKFEVPWEGLAPVELCLWEDVGPGTTILLQSPVKFLDSEWRILSRFKLCIWQVCYTLWFRCVSWYFFWGPVFLHICYWIRISGSCCFKRI